jgi:Ca2+-binding EF-hand superfamily protein
MDVNEMVAIATKELTAAFKKFDVDHSGFLEKN